MSFQVKACSTLDDLSAALAPMSQYFGFSPTPEFTERLNRILPPERVVGAHWGDRVVGGAAAYPFQLTVPGGRVPVAGLTFVAVLPTHRRHGILRAMRRAQLDACRTRGEPIAYLWASEDTIYGRFGFGLAGLMAEVDVARDRAQFVAAAALPGEIKIVPFASAESLVAPIYDSVAAKTPGMFTRSSAWWQSRLLIDPDWRRRGGGELQCAVLTGSAGPSAYAFYRLNMRFERGVNSGTVNVIEAAGTSAEATRAIWRYLLDIDWLSTLKAGLLPIDHPLLLLAAEPRKLNFTLRDGVWVRLVDVGAALAARSYVGNGSIVVEISDEFCPWNAGRWRIGGGGPCKTEAAADLSCDVGALASAYLGGFSWVRLADALRVKELRDGAIEDADALFRTPHAPWCPEIF